MREHEDCEQPRNTEFAVQGRFCKKSIVLYVHATIASHRGVAQGSKAMGSVLDEIFRTCHLDFSAN